MLSVRESVALFLMPVIDEGGCSGWNRTSKCLLLLKMLALGYLCGISQHQLLVKHG